MKRTTPCSQPSVIEQRRLATKSKNCKRSSNNCRTLSNSASSLALSLCLLAVFSLSGSAQSLWYGGTELYDSGGTYYDENYNLSYWHDISTDEWKLSDYVNGWNGIDYVVCTDPSIASSCVTTSPPNDDGGGDGPNVPSTGSELYYNALNGTALAVYDQPAYDQRQQIIQQLIAHETTGNNANTLISQVVQNGIDHSGTLSQILEQAELVQAQLVAHSAWQALALTQAEQTALSTEQTAVETITISSEVSGQTGIMEDSNQHLADISASLIGYDDVPETIDPSLHFDNTGDTFDTDAVMLAIAPGLNIILPDGQTPEIPIPYMGLVQIPTPPATFTNVIRWGLNTLLIVGVFAISLKMVRAAL